MSLTQLWNSLLTELSRLRCQLRHYWAPSMQSERKHRRNLPKAAMKDLGQTGSADCRYPDFKCQSTNVRAAWLCILSLIIKAWLSLRVTMRRQRLRTAAGSGCGCWWCWSRSMQHHCSYSANRPFTNIVALRESGTKEFRQLQELEMTQSEVVDW